MTASLEDRIGKLAQDRLDLIATLSTKPTGLSWCRKHTEILDEIIRLLCHVYGDSQFAVIATGGYGRFEVSPASDVDLTLIPADETSPEVEKAVRGFFLDLDHYLGRVVKIPYGYSYRLMGDVPGLDQASRTGLLDMRLVAGEADLVRALDNLLRNTMSPGEFVLAKAQERNEWLQKTHDTPLVVEPQLKEGAGGLRSFQASNWIRHAIGEQPLRPGDAYDLVVKNRNLLHFQAGRLQDHLTRSRQAEIADLTNQNIYVLMGQHVEAAVDLHREYERSLSRVRESRFPLAEGIFSDRGEVRFDGPSDSGDAAVAIAIATQLGLRVGEYQVVAPTLTKGASALYAMRAGEGTIRNLDRCGLLDSLLPELTTCRFLLPTDSVHDFTVFEHTMRVIRNLDELGEDPFLREVRDGITTPEAMYLAALLHDVGKAQREVPHSIAGEQIARSVTERWSLEPNLCDTVAWLVKEHLTMAQFIRMRDLMHPQTSAEFAEIVGDTNRLALLTLLTYADIVAVSKTTWTPAMHTFLRQLFESTSAILSGEPAESIDLGQTRRRLMRTLNTADTDPAAVEAFLESLPAYYLASTPPEVVRLHRHYAAEAALGNSTVDLTPKPSLSASEVTVCCPDAPGLLSRLLGVFYAFDLSLLAVRVATTKSNPAIALDTFVASFGGKSIPNSTAGELTRTLRQVISGEITTAEVLMNRGKDPARNQRLFTYTYREGNPGILEIRSPRGRGMPYRFSRLFAEQGWNVVSARVGQWAGNGAAAFYLLHTDGRAVRAEEIDEMLTSLR